jgi:integrase
VTRPRILHWSDVDLDAGRARITHTLGSISWQVVAGQPKTSAGRRPITLDPITVGVLRDHRKRMLDQRPLVGAGFVDQDFVFCEPDASPLHPERVYQSFRRRVRKHAFPYLSPHGLRHTWLPWPWPTASTRGSCKNGSCTRASRSRFPADERRR